MKKKYFIPIVFIILLFFSSSCVSHLTSPQSDFSDQFIIQKGSNKKVQICHRTENGNFVLIEISKNALEAHLAHGDKIVDADGDGHSSFDSCFGTMDDCDDNDPSVYPGAEEICGDGIDNNCNGEIDENCAPTVVADFFQGFEVDKTGWIDGGIFGTINLVTSGTNGINALGGAAFALFSATVTGPYSAFDGIQKEWTGPWTAEIAVFLDSQWQAGEGFDYTVTVSKTDGLPYRDFVFHAAKDQSTNQLLVAVSFTSGFSPRTDLETLDNIQITSAGWYILKHEFFEENGLLKCSMSLLDENKSTLFSKTLSNPSDQFATNLIGGNYRSWFTNINVADWLAVDNHSLVRN